MSEQDRLHQPLLDRLILLLLLCSPGKPMPSGPATEPEQDQLQQLLQWIDIHLHEPLNLAVLEARSGCARRTLQYWFRRNLDCTPMQWVHRRRLQQALQLLTSTTPAISVQEAASTCGYSNLSSFSRDFKRMHGRRPSDVKRQASGNASSTQFAHSAQ